MAPSDGWRQLFQLAGLLVLWLLEVVPSVSSQHSWVLHILPVLFLREYHCSLGPCRYHCISTHIENSSFHTYWSYITGSIKLQRCADLFLNLALPAPTSPTSQLLNPLGRVSSPSGAESLSVTSWIHRFNSISHTHHLRLCAHSSRGSQNSLHDPSLLPTISVFPEEATCLQHPR